MRYLLIRYINRTLDINYIDCLLIAYSLEMKHHVAIREYVWPKFNSTKTQTNESALIESCNKLLGKYVLY